MVLPLVTTLGPAPMAKVVAVAGLVMPAMVNVTAVASATVPVTVAVMTWPTPAQAIVAPAEKPVTAVQTGIPGIVNPAGNVVVMVPPVAMSPSAEVVKPIVYVSTAPTA